jgi:inactivated superfamily I helicase
MSKDTMGNVIDIVGEMSASRETAACYRLYAANCLEIAENIPDRDRRIFLLRIAQAWTRLADHIEKYSTDPVAETTTTAPRSTFP